MTFKNGIVCVDDNKNKNILCDFRLLVAKKVELELKALDADKFNRTMEELCREPSSNQLWLKCTHGIFK